MIFFGVGGFITSRQNDSFGFDAHWPLSTVHHWGELQRVEADIQQRSSAEFLELQSRQRQHRQAELRPDHPRITDLSLGEQPPELSVGGEKSSPNGLEKIHSSTVREVFLI